MWPTTYLQGKELHRRLVAQAHQLQPLPALTLSSAPGGHMADLCAGDAAHAASAADNRLRQTANLMLSANAAVGLLFTTHASS